MKPVLTQFAQSQGEVAAADITAVLEFILDRVRKLTLDDGVRRDLVSAGVSRSGNTDVVYLIDRINVLAAHSKDNDFRDVIESLTRVDRLAVKQLTNDSVDPSLFENDAEKELYQATYALNLSHLVKEGADEVYTTLAGLQSPISTYFEATMVNTENTAVKNNRYAQLNVIHRLISELGDLEQIVIK